MSYHFLFEIALILLSTKLLGMITRKFEMPQVVGALLAGLIMGPAILGILTETEFLNQVSEIGVIVLMFTAGLETDIGELKRSGKASFVIAVIGVVVPFAGGMLVTYFFNSDPAAVMQNVFIGVVLTATSVSITVETLKELGKLSTRSGNAILGAALIDDVLGIIALTVITSMSGSDSAGGAGVGMVLLKIVLFFALSFVAGIILYKLIANWMKKYPTGKRRFPVLSFAFCLIFSYVAEHFFGVADITGAFIAGLILSNTSLRTYIASRFEILSYMLLSPIFFASIGVKIVVPQMSGTIILYTVLLITVAILSKIVGCGLGAKMCHYTSKESMQIGVGMISRGEVALIVANKGIAFGLMKPELFGPLVITVIVTTVITPILLKIVYKGKKDYSDLVQSELVDNYENIQNVDSATQTMIELNEQMQKKNKNKDKEQK